MINYVIKSRKIIKEKLNKHSKINKIKKIKTK